MESTFRSGTAVNGAFSNGLRHVVLGFINFYVKKSKASKVVVLFLGCKFLFQTKQKKKS